MLFLCKVVRALNDNTASIIYNQTHTLDEFFNIGLMVCVFSMFCTVILVKINSNIFEMDQLSKNQNKKHNENAKEEDIPHPGWVIAGIYTVSYGIIHAFYPNFSKFL